MQEAPPKPQANPFSAERRNSKCIALRFEDVCAGWEQRILLRADAHWDHPESNLKMQRRHLEEARAYNAPILDFGDLFCIMQAPHDPRASYDGLKPEHKKRDYLNAVLDSAEAEVAPYADLWALFAHGNHETGVLKHHGFDITEELVKRLHSSHAGIGFAGQYRGWVQLMFTVRGAHRLQKRLYYTHGRGGQAPVTRGAIRTNRRAVYLPDADIVVGAHSHDEFRIPITRYRLTTQGREYVDDQLHIQLPSYKEAHKKIGGFEAEHEMPPKPCGATWLLLQYRDEKMHIDALRAV